MAPHPETVQVEDPADVQLRGQLQAAYATDLRVLARAQAVAWHDLPLNEKRTYLQHVITAMVAERVERAS